MPWKKINSEGFVKNEKWDFEKNPTLEAEYVAHKEPKDQRGKTFNVYTLKDEKGIMYDVMGGAVLDNIFPSISYGTILKITYKGLGEKKPGKNPAKLFDVYSQEFETFEDDIANQHP